MIRTLELFAGIGGIGLGLERTGGFEVVGQCEIDPFCREVLAKHWPHVWRHDDIATLTARLVREYGGIIDCIAGGFPCQDISTAGIGEGINADRSGLWWQMFRIIATVRPTWVIAENVPALRTRGADDVIAVLEAIGYSVWPVVVGAWAVGAPHKRDRVWIVGHAKSHIERRNGAQSIGRQEPIGGSGSHLEHSDSLGRSQQGHDNGRLTDGAGAGVANAEQCQGGVRYDSDLQRGWSGETEQVGLGCGHGLANTQSLGKRESPDETNPVATCGATWDESGDHRKHAWPARPGEPQYEWEESRLTECEVGDATDGLSARLVRFANRNALKAGGNSVVPQTPEAIGRAILRVEASR